MIKRLTITNRDNTSVEHGKECFSSGDTFDFSEGLNVIYGPNGTGKSTLLHMLTTATFCLRGGVPYPKIDAYDKTCLEFARRAKENTLGFELDKDNGFCFYNDPSKKVGLIGGMAAFDNDFTLEGFNNIQRNKASQGQIQMSTLLSFLSQIDEFKLRIPTPNDPIYKYVGTGEGRPTIILDEPDRNLDILITSKVWNIIASLSNIYQVIVVSHSVFGLAWKDANYIKLGDNHLKRFGIDSFYEHSLATIYQLNSAFLGEKMSIPKEAHRPWIKK